MSQERRQSDRYSWLSFEAKVYIKRSFFNKEWISVVPFDFSRFGLGIQTDEVYEIGQEVSLSFELKNEDLHISLPLIQGVTRYKEKQHSRFDYGVEFVFASKRERQEFGDDLIRIEQALKHFENSRSVGASDRLLNGV